MNRLFLLLATFLIASCGGGGDESDHPIVEYSGTTLLVRSIRYERNPANSLSNQSVCEASSICYKAGELLAQSTSSNAFEKMMHELSLSASAGGSNGITLVVPVQFERQWVAALQHEPSVASATVELIP